jgi:superfamily II DNA/RNA helicase
MIEIQLNTIGEQIADDQQVGWDELPLDETWLKLVQHLAPHSYPSDIQIKTIRDGGLMTSRRNILVSGPTNSGKSLLAYLALFRGLIHGGRVLLLEPLRAIAQEKYDELLTLTTEFREVFGREIGVSITTGDYRLNEETMQSPPPESGEIVIATPERIEAVMRNPDFDEWMESFRTVCVDEAHLLADPVRGASLEYVVTSLRTMKIPPRILLLSATLGDVTPLVNWLDPCDAVLSEVRKPPLKRKICQMEPDDDTPREIIEMIRRILETPEHSVLVFVYQTTWASSLARDIQVALQDACGTKGAACYHSRMSAATKASIRQQVQNGTTRCVVSTAALAMGVNLPTTHVIVRDMSYGPGAPIPLAALQQMIGRAGRGNRAGEAILVLKHGEERNINELQVQLETTNLPAIRSVFAAKTENDRASGVEHPMAKMVLSFLARRPEKNFLAEEVEYFIANTMNGSEVVDSCLPALRWLGNSSNLLVFENEGEWTSTRLGQATIRGSLPLKMAAGLGQLIRDLLSIDDTDQILLGFSMLDLLLLTELISERPMIRKPFSEEMAGQVDDWASMNDTKSVIFQNWIRGKKGFSKADEILGSLGFDLTKKTGTKSDAARKVAYQAMLRSIILWQRAHGALSADLERRWKVNDLDEIQEPWRDDRLFLLGAISNIWDVRCFFYHLKEECQAGDERTLRVKRALQRMKGMSLRMMNLVAWCSTLGPVFLRLRSLIGDSGQIPGLTTMRRLEEVGISDVTNLRSCSTTDLIKAGVRKDLANKIVSFLRRI